MNQFLSLRDFSAEQIREMLALANRLQKSPNRVLAGKVIGLLFMNPSLRTLASFQSGIARLGGTSIVIQPGTSSWKLETRDGAVMDGDSQEHIRDAIPVLASYCDALGVRCFASGDDLQADLADTLITRMAALSPKPFFSMESANDHPCQALADWKTMDEAEIADDAEFVLSWAWHPRPLPYAVPSAVADMAVRRGMRLTICRPDGYDLPDQVMAKLSEQGPVAVTSDRAEAYASARVVYVKSWARADAYGDPAGENEQRSQLRDWLPREDWFPIDQRDTNVMHCLPVRRNAELSDELLDGPRSLTLRQAENRMWAQMGMLATLEGDANG